MKYYTHKTTEEPLVILNGSMVDLHTSETSKEYPQLGVTSGVLQLCIFPERWAANGVPFQAIDFGELKVYKRISKKKYTDKYPDSGQLRHFNDATLTRVNNQHDIFQVRKREKTFGT